MNMNAMSRLAARSRRPTEPLAVSTRTVRVPWPPCLFHVFVLWAVNNAGSIRLLPVLSAASESSRPMLARLGRRIRGERKQTSGFVCCVCLDEVACDEALLPCCGRVESATRVCKLCLRRICEEADASCPACRAGLWFDSRSGTARVAIVDGPHTKPKPAYLLSPFAFFLLPLWRLLLSILLVLLRPVLRLLDNLLQGTLEAVFSRGPV